MKAKLSPLQVKHVIIRKCKIEENVEGTPKQNLALDFDAGITEDGMYILTIKLNFNKSSREPMLKVEAEADFLFSIDPGLPEDQKIKLLVYNGLAIAYGMLRGIVFQKCCMLPPDFRILPGVNLLPLIEEKLKQEDEAAGQKH